MRILYFYQYFSTPSGSWGTRVFEFASEWVKQGHQVTVVTSVYSKSDLKARRLVEVQWFDGIRVIIINVRIDNKQSLLKRIFTFLFYSLSASWFALTERADVVIASSGPITVGIPGLVARYFRGRKLVFEARDLWPDGAIELGIIKNRVIINISRWFESKCYKASGLVVALSPGMAEHIKVNHHHQNVVSITNAANIGLLSHYQQLPDKFPLLPFKYVIYTGNIGEVNNALLIFSAAVILKKIGREDIKIVMVGDGQQKQLLKNKAAKENLDQLILLDLIPKNDLVPLIQNAIASLVTLKNSSVLNTSSPNKFFESLAAGVPVIQTTNGWMMEFLNLHQIGYTVNPDDPAQLARVIINLFDDPASTRLMGAKASKVASEYFDKNLLAAQMLNEISRIVS